MWAIAITWRLSSSVGVNIFQTLTPLTPQVQWLWNLAQLFISIGSIKLAWGFLIRRKTWPPWLKIEHRGKLQFLANNSKTVTDIKNLTWGRIVQNDKIYLSWNFDANPNTHVGVIALFSSNFQNFHILDLLFRKL